MDALVAILEALSPPPWLVAGSVAILFVVLTVFKYFEKTLSESGPGRTRVRKNLERKTPYFREQYYFVVLSMRRALDDRFGAPDSSKSKVNSFEFFLKVSAFYGFAALLVTYLISGHGSALLNVFDNSLSVNERGVLAICATTGVGLSLLVYFENPKRQLVAGFAAFSSVIPFVFAGVISQIIQGGYQDDALSYWWFFVLYLSFVAGSYTTVNNSGFVAMLVVLSFLFALIAQFALQALALDLLGLQIEDFPRREFWIQLKLFLFSVFLLLIFLVTSLFPLVIRWVAVRFERGGVSVVGKTKFYTFYMLSILAVYVVVSALGVGRGAPSLLLLLAVVVPTLSAVMDWLVFQAADKVLTISVANEGKYVVSNLIALVAIAVIASSVVLGVLIIAVGISSYSLVLPDGRPGPIGVQTFSGLLIDAPGDPRLWWVYSLMAFNLLPVLIGLASVFFGLLSWHTPRWLADRYANQIKRGFRGDYPKLVESSAFLTARLVISSGLSVLVVVMALWLASYSIFQLTSLVARAASFVIQ